MAFHRLVFKGPSYADAFAQAKAHLINAGEPEFADRLAAIDPEAMEDKQGPFTSGFTEIVWGRLDPWPYNEGHTRYVRVKWNDTKRPQ